MGPEEALVRVIELQQRHLAVRWWLRGAMVVWLIGIALLVAPFLLPMDGRPLLVLSVTCSLVASLMVDKHRAVRISVMAEVERVMAETRDGRGGIGRPAEAVDA